jgi:hypothetical protein
MGQAKNRAIMAKDDWRAKAGREGHACSIFARAPDYHEIELFLLTGMCSACAISTGALNAYWRTQDLR